MRSAPQITTRNIAQHAWRAGFRGVTGLARELGVHRVSVYKALRFPNRHRPLVRRLHDAVTQRNA